MVGVSKKRSLLPAPKTHSKLPTSSIPQPHSSSEDRETREVRSPSVGLPDRSSQERSSPKSPRSPKEGSPEGLTVGDRVVIAGVKQGVLQYFGRTHFAEGEWCGIELDEQEGKNDGTVEQVRYFSCEFGYGIFAPKDKVCLIGDGLLGKESGLKREASTERTSRLKHPKTSQLAQPQSRGSSPDDRDTHKFQSKLKPRAIVKPLHTAKEDEKANTSQGKASVSSAKPSKLPLGKFQGKREHKTSHKSGIPLPGKPVTDDFDDEMPTVVTPSRVDPYTALTLAYDLNDSSGSDSDNRKSNLQLDLEKRSTQSEPSLNSPVPDILIPAHTKYFGGEAMSDDENVDLMAMSTISHASSLGLLADDDLCNTSLLSHDIKKAIIAKEAGIVDQDTLDLLERELDDEISGIATPEHDMSSSTISGKEISSSPEPDGLKENGDATYTVPDIPDEDADKKDEVGGEKMASPSSSENSPETENLDSTYVIADVNSAGSARGSKEDLKSESSSRNSSKRSSLYNLIDEMEEYPKQKRMVEEDAAAGVLSPPRSNSTLELAKVAVSQYADLVRSAEEEKARHQARRSLTSSRGSSRSSSRDSISSSPAREPKAETLNREELLKKLDMPTAMAVSVESDMTGSINSSMTLSVQSGDITEEPMEVDATDAKAKDPPANPYEDVMMSSVSDECGNVLDNADTDSCTYNDNDILVTLDGYSMTRERTFTISTISEESSNMEDSLTSLSESGKPTIPGPPRDATFTIEEKPDEVADAEQASDDVQDVANDNKAPSGDATFTIQDKQDEVTDADPTSDVIHDNEAEQKPAGPSRDVTITIEEKQDEVADAERASDDVQNVTYDKPERDNASEEVLCNSDTDLNITLESKPLQTEDLTTDIVSDIEIISKQTSLNTTVSKERSDKISDKTVVIDPDSTNLSMVDSNRPCVAGMVHVDNVLPANFSQKMSIDSNVDQKPGASQAHDALLTLTQKSEVPESQNEAEESAGDLRLSQLKDSKDVGLNSDQEITKDEDGSIMEMDLNDKTDDLKLKASSDLGEKSDESQLETSVTDLQDKLESRLDTSMTGGEDVCALNAQVLKDLRMLRSQDVAMTASAEAQQLLLDLQAGHTKQARPISLISDISVDTGLGSELTTSLHSSVSTRPRPTSSLLSSTISIDTGMSPPLHHGHYEAWHG